MLIDIALILNIIIILLEAYALLSIKHKAHIFKYYTYLQNFITLLISILFSAFYFFEIFEFIKGLRYVATCGLISTMIIYALFLRKENIISKEDVLNNVNPKIINIFLHYICPILSLVSFVFFEREIVLENGIWTMIVNIPSIAYWGIYIVLSSAKKWQEPYKFSNNKNKWVEAFVYIAIPLIFIMICIILWNIK